MKKLLTAVILTAIMSSLACVAALAAETPTEGGIYGLSISEAFQSVTTVEALDESGNAVSESEAEINGSTVDFYANAVQLKVSLTGLTDGQYYLILAQSDDGMPTSGNIVYIDQDTAEDGTVVFTVYPSDLEADNTYFVYLSSSESERQELLSFQYYVAYKLGDVNEDKAVNATDALWILQNYAGNRTFSANQKLAADVNKDKAVNATDALWVLQAFAGNRNLGN